MKAISTITNAQLEQALNEINADIAARKGRKEMCDSVLPNPNPTEGQFNIARVEALENLAEVVGMYCEQVPAEVREALHGIPEIEKQHGHDRSPVCQEEK